MRHLEGISLSQQNCAPIVTIEGAMTESVCLDAKTGDLLVRVYEFEGACSPARLYCADASVVEGVDLLYRSNEQGVNVRQEADAWCFDLHPFQIATLRIKH